MKKTPRHPIFRVTAKNGKVVHINDLKAYCAKFGLQYKTVFSQISASSTGYADEVRTIRRIYLTSAAECDF
jgi:aspartate aminotransferase-like enzyme